MGEAIGSILIIAGGVLLGMQAHTFIIGIYARYAYRKHRDQAIASFKAKQQAFASLISAKGQG